MWDAIAERYAAEDEDEDPLAVNRHATRRPGKYWSR
jgi:hypothetical protein